MTSYTLPCIPCLFGKPKRLSFQLELLCRSSKMAISTEYCDRADVSSLLEYKPAGPYFGFFHACLYHLTRYRRLDILKTSSLSFLSPSNSLHTSRHLSTQLLIYFNSHHENALLCYCCPSPFCRLLSHR